jgi:hypothetical protein
VEQVRLSIALHSTGMLTCGLDRHCAKGLQGGAGQIIHSATQYRYADLWFG